MTESVYLAIGSNIEAHTHVIRAIQMLRDKFGAIRLSPIFRTPAEGFVGDAFLNLVVQFSTRLTLTCLLYTSPSPRDKRQSRMPSSA